MLAADTSMVVATVVMGFVGAAATIAAVLLQKTRDENATQHAQVQATIIGHTAKIGKLEGEMVGVRSDLGEVKADVREIRDAVVVAGR